MVYQFKRINNVYFLIISILCLFKFSPKNPWSLIGTFSLVLLFTMLKEGYEDIGRHRQDKEVNKAKVLKLDKETCSFVITASENLKVGDIIQINKDQSIPADLLLISSSDEKGVAFVNTMNLDGETNLKEKISVDCLKRKSLSEYRDLDCAITADPPSPNLVK